MNLETEAHKGLLFITSFRAKTAVQQRGQNPSSALEGLLMPSCISISCKHFSALQDKTKQGVCLQCSLCRLGVVRQFIILPENGQDSNSEISYLVEQHSVVQQMKFNCFPKSKADAFTIMTCHMKSYKPRA